MILINYCKRNNKRLILKIMNPFNKNDKNIISKIESIILLIEKLNFDEYISFWSEDYELLEYFI